MDNAVDRWIASLPSQGMHAFLITGAGREEAAKRAAAAMLCERRGEEACGQCMPCRLIASGNHPDFLRLRRSEKDKFIKIDAVRALIGDCHIAPHFFRKVVWIEEAHTMNEAAQNALLRTLEEPPDEVRFLLTGAEAGLLPTIRSRCAVLRLGGGAEATADAEAVALAVGALRLIAQGKAVEAAAIYADKKHDTSALFAAQTVVLRDRIAGTLGRPPLGEGVGAIGDWSIGSLSIALELTLEARRRIERNFSAALTADWFAVSMARIWQRDQAQMLARLSPQ